MWATQETKNTPSPSRKCSTAPPKREPSLADVTGIITLPEGTEMCMPGDNVMMHVELLTPVAMEEGLRFAIREGGRTVGSGVVGKIIE